MKQIAFALLLLPVLALEVAIEPSYVRTPSNSTVSFSVRLEGGSGELYTVEAFGPYLSWSSRDVWVGPQGKTLDLEFHPTSPGEYTVTVRAGNSSASATALVYRAETGEDVLNRILELRERVRTEEERKALEEIEQLYNQSRFELARLRIRDLESRLTEESGGTTWIRVLILPALLVVAVVLTKLLTG